METSVGTVPRWPDGPFDRDRLTSANTGNSLGIPDEFRRRFGFADEGNVQSYQAFDFI